MTETFAVWKYEIEITDYFDLQIPEGSTILSVQVQERTPCLWALVNPNNPKRTYKFRLAGPGHPVKIEESDNYLGTFQMQGGALVFHLFLIYFY